MRSLIDSTQIEQFFVSKRRDAQSLLPHLVRKLLFATVDPGNLHRCGIPVGDDISRPGYDGRVETSRGNAFVPKGFSVWEMGLGTPQSKAEEDYIKRSKEPGEVKPCDTTFVFVTPRRWQGKDAWRNEKLKDKIWKDVRVIDNSDLETWLETGPGVARWLAGQIGIPVSGLRDLDLFLQEFGAIYGVRPSTDLLIGGRDEASDSLGQWLRTGGQEITVNAKSIEEASVFIAAVMCGLGEEVRDSVCARVVFVDDPNALDFFAPCRATQLVVPLNLDCLRRAKALASAPFRLVIPQMQAPGHPRKTTGTIHLGTIRRNSCRDALVDMGIPSQQAEIMSRESKGSLEAVLWMIARHWDQLPEWMTGEAALELVPLVLAGQWDSQNEDDRAVIEELASRPYDDIEKTLAKWMAPRGPLVLRRSIWDWLAWTFAWDRLAPQMTREQVRRFCETAKRVLETPDPRFELDAGQRWAAAIYEKVPPHSNALRSGLVSSIVQLALHDSDFNGMSGQSIADNVVRDLLTEISKPRKDVWLCLLQWLSDLAEAAPIVFLEAVETLCQDRDSLTWLFEAGGFFSTSPHTYLLWALETLAWQTDLLTRVTLALGQLAALDPGGQTMNRPSYSLTRIYLPWHPQNSADVEHQFEALNVLFRKNPGIAWNLVTSLLPKHHMATDNTSAPRWRDWKPDEDVRVTVGEYLSFVERLITHALEWAGHSGQRWSDLVGAYDELRQQYPKVAKRLLEALKSLNLDELEAGDRLTLREALGRLLSHHREVPDAEWAMTANDLRPFDELYGRLEPPDPIDKYALLFAHWPRLPECQNLGYEELEKQIAEQSTFAIHRVYGKHGLVGLWSLAEKVERPDRVGWHAGALDLSDAETAEILMMTLRLEPTAEGTPTRLQMGYSFVAAAQHRYGAAYVDRVLSLEGISWDANMYANFALGLPFEGSTWNLLEGWGTEAKALYWKRTTSQHVRNIAEDAERAIREFLAAGRPYSAIILISMSLHRWQKKADEENTLCINASTIREVLEEAPRHDLLEERRLCQMDTLGHRVSELLDLLESTGMNYADLAGIEWMWLPVLDRTKRGLKALDSVLSVDPRWFVEALQFAYRGDNDEPRELSQGDRARASQASRLLEQWHHVPGLADVEYPDKKKEGDIQFPQGQLDEEAFTDWVMAVRELASECDRLDICDFCIGRVLAFSPYDSREECVWPCAAVCRLIEKLRSDGLERGIENGICNKRGVHWRQKGGEQERVLVTKFRKYAQQTCSQWPRTSALLGRIADTYDRLAREEDDDEAFKEFE